MKNSKDDVYYVGGKGGGGRNEPSNEPELCSEIYREQRTKQSIPS